MPDINELVEARQRFLEGEELHEDRSLVIRILGDLIQAKELIQGISGVLLPGMSPSPSLSLSLSRNRRLSPLRSLSRACSLPHR